MTIFDGEIEVTFRGNVLPGVGVPVTHRTEAPPPLDEAAAAAFIAKAVALAPKYRTELLLEGPTA